MKGISLNGNKLHEIQMPLVPYSKGTSAYLKYPKHRIQCERMDKGIVLKLPAFLALELYRLSILPQEQTKYVTVEISGKKIGRFVVVDFRYPNDHSEIVAISLHREAKEKEK